MPLSPDLAGERHFHDAQAAGRAGRFTSPSDFHFSDDAYLDHETWIRPAFARLGDVRGLRVLDFGCGHGMAGVVLARRGARVVGFDLSGAYLREADARARANGAAVHHAQADGHVLPFADGSFDRVWGNAILHHLDLARAGRELRRVLRPGGRAVFCEPWGENPLLNWARRRLPYPGKERTPDEAPLRRDHLGPLRESFADVRAEGFQVLGMARRVVRLGSLKRALDWCDTRLLRIPGFGRLCRYVVLTLE